MRVNLDKDQIKNYRYGKILADVYQFGVRWYDPEAIDQPYEVKKDKVNKYIKMIQNEQLVSAPIIVTQYGLIAGIHILEAFKELKFKRIPVLWGKYK
jgi:hypothetical protein